MKRIKRYDITLSAANTPVTLESAFTDKMLHVYGFQLLHTRAADAAYAADTVIKDFSIRDERLFDSNISARILQAGMEVPPNQRYYPVDIRDPKASLDVTLECTNTGGGYPFTLQLLAYFEDTADGYS